MATSRPLIAPPAATRFDPKSIRDPSKPQAAQSGSSWWWPSSWWSSKPPGPTRTTDAIHSPIIRQRFHQFLDSTEPPASFKASAAAQELSYNELVKLGYEDWREVLPVMIELAFEMREYGDCVILKGNKVLGDDVSAYDIEGDVRIRRGTGQSKFEH